MSACTPPAASRDVCPDLEEMRAATFALLPRGRAWGTHDGGPWPRSVIYRFFSVIAELRRQFNARMCDLRRQFWCDTTDEMLDVWLTQYGLPDDCDPFPDLCDKVRAIGGQTCDYFRDRTHRKGWVIDCIAFHDRCGAQFGCSRYGAGVTATSSNRPRFGSFRAGLAMGCDGVPAKAAAGRYGARDASGILIRVYTKSSPAFVAPSVSTPRFGTFRAGQRLACADSGLSGLFCLMERIAPAHARVDYVIV